MTFAGDSAQKAKKRDVMAAELVVYLEGAEGVHLGWVRGQLRVLTATRRHAVEVNPSSRQSVDKSCGPRRS